MLVNDTITKEKYENIKDVEGYIQLSGKKLEIFENKTLPTWEDLHQNNNFIIEAHFFDKKENKSISIKQINDTYKYFEKVLSKDELENVNIYKAKKTKKVKIATIWEEKVDEHCENFKVLKPTCQVFVGFEKGEEK